MMKKGKSTGAPAKTKAAGRAKPASVRAKTSKRDPRKVAPPTAPAGVAAKAVEAIAPVAAVATAEPKQAAAATPAAGSKAPVDGSHSSADRAMTLGAAAVPFAGAFSLGADQARAAYLRAGAGNENLRQAVADSTTTTTRGLVELNGKVLDLWRAQSD